MALFAFLAWLVATGRTMEFDEAALSAIFGIREDGATAVFRVLTFCGDLVVIGGLCVFLMLLPGRMKIGVPIAIMVAAGWFAGTVIKGLVGRPRPDTADWLVDTFGYGFPSGHAVVSMIFWVALMILVGRVLILQDNRLAAALLRVVFLVLAVLIGFSRLYLGVHYPTDVLGGWLLAGGVLMVSFAFYENFWPYKWRVTYNMPEWDAIPRNAEKKRVWKAPSKKRAPSKMLEFPKKRRPWKMERPGGDDDSTES
ncbi:MAG: phosphatase PAP2 family protein [Clostridiales bacterium]|nr:phosphatase PAP2 family protein [Clostridiales bacterium]